MATLAERVRPWWERLLRTPSRLWWSSLPLRVIASTLGASTVVMLLGGFLLMQQATDGILRAKQQAALAEAAVALDTAQRSLQAADLATSNVNEVLTRLAVEVVNRGASGGQYEVVVQGPVSDIQSPRVSATSVPEMLRSRVGEAEGTWVTPTEIAWTDGTPPVPGLAVGGSLVAPGTGRYAIYFLFPLTSEMETLQVVQRAVVTTGTLLVLALTAVAALVARQVVDPVREARLTAGRLAAGHLDDRLRVRGSDDLAGLATSMNFMASELQKQIEQLEELSRVQQRFVSDVSHELRTPLTTVRMAAEVLHDAREDLEPLAARSAELLYHEVDRFEGLLGDLLEISRFDAGAAVLQTEETDVLDLVEREVAAQRAFAERSGTPLTIIRPTRPCTAEVDPRRITRILRNLITNAIEHGEGRPIDIWVEGNEDAVAVAVRDHGIGFEAAQAKQVFHRFWRADPARARTVGGTGLGLAISLEDARLHSGWLNAWGRPGMGAQFRLTVPRVRGGMIRMSPLPAIPRDLTLPGLPPPGGPRAVEGRGGRAVQHQLTASAEEPR
ncbi:MtrAB system histidine kinase MtrB [Desertihabitans aurantiacus]|uniref:MtrAB system histidine kinase MtrB n=1 Tax=Desertihabitans aurantiacus TaxID=2282477 RepID=UPI0022B80405|nr:MtrAB system histidine kinase MtrB [Desertihabitans aurantiacus]